MLPCVVLCGGLATRLYPLTEQVPKSLVQVDGKPFLYHQLRLLQSQGIRDAILCIGHMGHAIQSYGGDGSEFGVRLRYSSDAPLRLGTAGAIRKALEELPPIFFVLYGDSYLQCDYGAIARSFHQSGKQALMTIHRNDDRFDRSNVEAQNGRIVRYDKAVRTPEMQYIDYGLGVFNRQTFAELPSGQPVDLQFVYQNLLAQGQLAAFEVSERFYEIGSPEGLRDLERYLAR